MSIDARLYIATSNINNLDLRDLSWRLGAVFGSGNFYFPNEDKPCLAYIGDVIEQDGPDLPAPAGKTWIEVHIWTRFYGPGYERGDALLIIHVAEFLEQFIPNSSIYYGGDSSGVCAAPFGTFERKQLLRHFFNVDHEPYARAFGSSTTLCRRCQKPMSNSSGRGNRTFLTCIGCGNKAIYVANEPVKWLDRYEDFISK